ncbi:MAG: DUF2927 domain-containing protein [Variibacter sp.]|nr:DUF2927 domain-containing protein [Variibacter sp.]
MACGKARGAALAAMALLAWSGGWAAAQHPEIEKRRAAERTSFSDAEIARGFFKVAFGAELGLGGRVDRIRKYEQPVRVYVEGAAPPERHTAVARVVDDIRRHVAHIDIAMTRERRDANFIVRLVRDRDLARTVRAIYGANGSRIVRSLEPQCLSGIRKDDRYRIVGSDVILVVDAGTFIFYDCAYEELLQALGPIRDDPTVPWTMFNDDVQMGFFDVYDQYLLNILYHPRIRAGMTRAEVRRLLPAIMPDVRAFVAAANGLPR